MSEHIENPRPVGRRPKRPAGPIGKGIPVRFPEALVEEIKRLADRDGMTVSAWIRNVIGCEVQRRSADRATSTTITSVAPGPHIEWH